MCNMKYEMLDGNSDAIERGTILRLSKIGRRKFLKIAALSGITGYGFKKSIESAYGQPVDGVPLVHTYDLNGNPDRVKIISEERKKKIKTYSELDTESHFPDDVPVHGMTIRQDSASPNDLKITVFLDEPPSTVAERDLTQNINGVSAEYRSLSVKIINSACDYRFNDFEAMRGGWAIGPGNNYNAYGTLSFVTDYGGTPMLFTSGHVAYWGGYANDLYQPHRNITGADVIGKFNKATPSNTNGYDMVSYTGISNVDYQTNMIHRNDVPDLSGTWSFSGLVDRTSSPKDPIPCQYSGARQCKVTNTCVDTYRSVGLKKIAVMNTRQTKDGDSGAAYMDDYGNLVAINKGAISINGDPYKDFGPPGQEAISSVT